jgi:CheY-like chemotaxis protein
MLPDADGFDLCHRLRADPKYASVGAAPDRIALDLHLMVLDPERYSDIWELCQGQLIVA